MIKGQFATAFGGNVASIKQVRDKLLADSAAALLTLNVGQWTAFTPTVTLVGGAGNTVPVYTTNSARFCRAGNLISGYVFLSGDGGAEGAGTGTINIALPVTASSNIVQIDCRGRAGNGATQYLLDGVIVVSATTISIRYFTSISATAVFTGADQNNTTRFISLSFLYEA